MTQEQQAPGDPVAASPKAAALEEIKPYVLTAAAVSLFGTPAEIAVPIVRRLRRQSGISVGPALMNLANGVVALGVVHHLRQRPAEAASTLPRWGPITALVYVAASPAAAAGWRRGVILRRRSPLWGALISPIGLLQGALVLVPSSRPAVGPVPGPALSLRTVGRTGPHQEM